MIDRHNQPAQLMILLGLTLFNLLILAGLFPNAIPALQTVHLIVLAAIELPVILLIYRYIKRNSAPVSF